MPVPLPALLMFHTPLPVAASDPRTCKPLAVMLITPWLVLVQLYQWPARLTLAVALALTVMRSSEPFKPKSVMVSVEVSVPAALPMMKVSLPEPPVKVLLLVSPVMLSFQAVPMMFSTFASTSTSVPMVARLVSSDTVTKAPLSA